MLEEYKKHVAERAKLNIPPLPLSADQTSELVNLLKNDHEEADYLLNLFKERIPAGVDQAAYVKAAFLTDITTGKTESPHITKVDAVKVLGTMLGGYNIQPLINCLKDEELADEASKVLSKTLLIFDAFNEIFELSKENSHAQKVIEEWANGSWFTEKEDIKEQIKLTVFKVTRSLNVMPLDMPESVLVKFKGEMQPGITLRDLVNAIPYAALQRGLLTIDKDGKKNVFSGRCLEIEGLPNMKVEQAFELSDASAERSASGCTVKLNKEPILEYLQSNIVMLRWMIASGYGDPKTLERRAQSMEEWILNPKLLEADDNAEYAEVIEIDLNEIKEPLLACPNDPDDIKPLSEVANTKIQEVFIGSCMTNIGHFRAAGTLLEKYKNIKARLWVVPPTKMDEKQLIEEGIYNIFGVSGARTEVPGCSLCMGNQARVLANSTVVSTSTRNFPNRLGDGANVFLASAELSAICAVLGRIPTEDEYHKYMDDINPLSDEIYRYLNFNEIDTYVESANNASIPAVNIVNPA